MGFFKKFFSLGSKNKKHTRTIGVRYNDNDLYAPHVMVDSNGRLEGPKSKHNHNGNHHREKEKERERDRDKDNGEAAATRLLRSSSARFAVVSEMDYTSLPPIRE